jgi:hypothetical protein
MDDQTTLTEVPSVEPAGTTAEDTLGLVVLWSRDEPWRVGEVFLLPQGSGPLLLGRGGFRADDPHPRLVPHRLRRGSAAATQPLASPTISRRQLLCRVKGGRIELQNIGRCAMRVGGVEKQTADVGVGALIELGNSMLIGCGWQPAWSYDAKPPLHRFGAPDANGIVGESSTMWRLRERIRFVAGLDGHVLVRGDSGTGKELVVRALHAHGDGGAFVSRNAATVPDGLVDAELFGNARNYPNAGMSERRGLVGDASGGTLFLDEFAEIPMSVQPHLLRVLDDGEYQRLGDTTPRISRFRLIAATNQPLEALRHDLLARFRFIGV